MDLLAAGCDPNDVWEYVHRAGFYSLLGLTCGYAVARVRTLRWRRRHFEQYHPDCDHTD